MVKFEQKAFIMDTAPEYQESLFAPLLEKIENAISVMKGLSLLERHFALVQLIEGKQISFPDLSKMYVDFLQKDRDAKEGETATLSLWVGVLCDDNTDHAHMRRFLWEKGYHRGSAYGDKLDKEFAGKL